MPELPEVQTIVSDLNKKIKGDTITGFWSDWAKAIKNASLDKFKKEIKNGKILGTRRIGKNIFIDLSSGKTIFIHLKMTGHLLIKSEIRNPKSKKNRESFFDDKVNKYVHHIFYLGKNKKMEFSDLRKFAKIVLEKTEKIKDLKEIKGLGVDVMSSEFTFEKLEEILEKKNKKNIRDILMDQNSMSGIGNIYCSEILFDAEILPGRPAKDISQKERKRLYASIRKILKKAIELRGTSDSDYRDTDGAPGKFQHVLKVYRKTGKPCPKCGIIIKRLKMGQRSVFFCPKCQR
jgi:formamidopyrimidine-DNA glycosylase